MTNQPKIAFDHLRLMGLVGPGRHADRNAWAMSAHYEPLPRLLKREEVGKKR